MRRSIPESIDGMGSIQRFYLAVREFREAAVDFNAAAGAIVFPQRRVDHAPRASLTAEYEAGEGSGRNMVAHRYRNDARQQEAPTGSNSDHLDEEVSYIAQFGRRIRESYMNMLGSISGYVASDDEDGFDDDYDNNYDYDTDYDRYEIESEDSLLADAHLPSRETFLATGLLSLNVSSARPAQDCSICMEAIDVSTTEARESATVVVSCGHIYHRTCIMRWFHEPPPDAVYGTDPLCRQRLFVFPTPDMSWLHDSSDEDDASESTESSDDDLAAVLARVNRPEERRRIAAHLGSIMERRSQRQTRNVYLPLERDRENLRRDEEMMARIMPEERYEELDGILNMRRMQIRRREEEVAETRAITSQFEELVRHFNEPTTEGSE